MQRLLRITSKVFLIELTSTNLSHTKWIICFCSVSFAFVSRWPTASLSFSRVIWWVTGLLEEQGVDEIQVESREDARLAVGVAMRLLFAFNSMKPPIGKANDFNWSSVICVIARKVSMFSSTNFFRRSFCCFEKAILSINSSANTQALTVGNTLRENQLKLNSQGKSCVDKEGELRHTCHRNKS